MYIDIKIGNERYMQRSEFSKLTIINDNGLKYYINSLQELPEFQQIIINASLDMKENPDKYFKYKENDNSVIITGYIGNFKHVIIPEEINGKTVCGIEKIFSKEDKIETIILPDTITKIPRGFCNEILSLKFVQLSLQITSIPTEAFTKCKKLRYINLENINDIGAYGFYECSSLQNVNLEKVEEIKPFGFSNCINLTLINLPNITKLFPNAFAHCVHLKQIKLNENITSIKEYVFEKCLALNSIELPINLKKIEKYAFYGCMSLKSITLPETLKEIEESAFEYSGLSETLNLPKKLTTIGPRAFFAGNLKKVNISKKTKYKQNSFYMPYVDIKKYEEEKKITNPILGEER